MTVAKLTAFRLIDVGVLEQEESQKEEREERRRRDKKFGRRNLYHFYPLEDEPRDG
jgi:hypothetical protein